MGTTIESSQQAYWYLRALHKENKAMLFTYKEYESDFGVIKLELAATEDSQLKVLVLKPKWQLSCQMTFTQDNTVIK